MSIILPNVIAFLPYVIPEGKVRSQLVCCWWRSAGVCERPVVSDRRLRGQTGSRVGRAS